MAAREHQSQSLVRDRRLVVGGRLGHLLQRGQQLAFSLEGPFAADPVDRRIPGGRDDPRAGVGGDAGLRPALERGREGLLDRILGSLEVAEGAGQEGYGASPLLPEDCLDYAAASVRAGTIGRTSIEPIRADGIFDAHSIASSSVPTSMM